jgi:hypothetical protein
MSRLLGLSLLAAMALAAPARAEMVHLKANLTGAQEVPAKTTTGKGEALATLDTATKLLSYTVEYLDLSGPATAAHIHGPAAAGANAGVLVPFASAASPISGSATLTDAQVTDLMAGKMYVNVHTAANPAGEIRGQLEK